MIFWPFFLNIQSTCTQPLNVSKPKQFKATFQITFKILSQKASVMTLSQDDFISAPPLGWKLLILYSKQKGDQ